MNKHTLQILLTLASAIAILSLSGCANLSEATGRRNPGDAAGVPDPTVTGGVDFNGPTVGGPLYSSDNMNWEQAPPFGSW